MEISYKNYNKYYSLRTKVLGIQDAAKTSTFRVIKRYLSDCKTILDVGCGRGMFLIPLKKIGKKITGLDFCESNIEILKNNGYEVYKCDCVKEIPYKETYDAVICCEVLEHLSESESKRLLDNIHNSIKDNGKLLITVPYRERYEHNVVVCPYCDKTFHRHGHVRKYIEVNELISELEKQRYSYMAHELIMEIPLSSKIPLIGHKLMHAVWPDRPANLISLFRKR